MQVTNYSALHLHPPAQLIAHSLQHWECNLLRFGNQSLAPNGRSQVKWCSSLFPPQAFAHPAVHHHPPHHSTLNKTEGLKRADGGEKSISACTHCVCFGGSVADHHLNGVRCGLLNGSWVGRVIGCQGQGVGLKQYSVPLKNKYRMKHVAITRLEWSLAAENVLKRRNCKPSLFKSRRPLFQANWQFLTSSKKTTYTLSAISIHYSYLNSSVPLTCNKRSRGHMPQEQWQSMAERGSGTKPTARS